MYERNPELSFAVLGGDMVNSGIALDEFDLVRENAKIGSTPQLSITYV